MIRIVGYLLFFLLSPYCEQSQKLALEKSVTCLALLVQLQYLKHSQKCQLLFAILSYLSLPNLKTLTKNKNDENDDYIIFIFAQYSIEQRTDL